MQLFHPFLRLSNDKSVQALKTSAKLKLCLVESLKTFDFEFILHEDLCYFRDVTSKKVYALEQEMKIQPLYEANCTDQMQISQIKFHAGAMQMSITSQNIEQLVKMYQKMKLIYSHKGFNQFFKPIKRLGRGAFATVYLIENKISKKRYAAKVFSKEGQKLQFKGHEALQNEIRTLRFLSHENIIKYEGVYETQNLTYLVTEYLSGGTLQEIMRNRSNLKGQDIIKIIKEMLATLQYLQKKYVMHRDLKPENILLRESDKKWVLIDFGLSGFSKEDYLYDACGTYGYMAPEMLQTNNQGNNQGNNQENNQKPKTYNTSCDIYSLGVIAYNLVIGELPFKVEGGGFMKEAKMVWNGFVSTECSELNEQIIIFLKGLLQKQPQKRSTPRKALNSYFFNKQEVQDSFLQFNQKKLNERYERILKIANCN